MFSSPVETPTRDVAPDSLKSTVVVCRSAPWRFRSTRFEEMIPESALARRPPAAPGRGGVPDQAQPQVTVDPGHHDQDDDQDEGAFAAQADLRAIENTRQSAAVPMF